MRILPLVWLMGCPGPSDSGDAVPDDSDAAAPDEDTDCEPTMWFADADGDGHGDPDAPTEACDAPSGHAIGSDDCDDADPAVHPGADEVCDDVDQDCDGGIDEDAIDPTAWHPDGDRDGFGDPSVTLAVACDAPAEAIADGSDCDDADPAVNPAATEWCNGWDDDCDGLLDRADPSNAGDATWYADADGDGWGDGASTLVTCSPPSGWVVPAGDCDDTSSARYPGAEEVRTDDVDDDCDGVAEKGHIGAVTASAADATWPIGGADLDGVRGLSTLGDVDGDGLDEYAIGAPGLLYHFGGWVYFIDATVRGTNPPASADGVLVGEEFFCCDSMLSSYGDSAGISLAYAGDADGDSSGELWVGSRYYPLGSLDYPAATPGAVFLVSADWSGSGSLDDVYEARLDGESDGDSAGEAVADAGDVDGDGNADVVVGAPGYAAGSGAAYVVYGPVSGPVDLRSADVKLRGGGGAASAGSSVAGGQDIDGDGLPDAVVGARGEEAMYIVSDPPKGTTSLTSYATAPIGATWAGCSVASPGDVDGDGYADALVGSTGGEAWIYLGPASGATLGADVTLSGPTASYGGRAGQAVAGGDVDGDGVSDVLIGGPYSGTSGQAWLIYGPIAPATLDLDTDADATFSGESSEYYFGGSVAVVGDADGDGANDLLIGGGGAVWLFTGP